jgi:hypothetical protein
MSKGFALYRQDKLAGGNVVLDLLPSGSGPLVPFLFEEQMPHSRFQRCDEYRNRPWLWVRRPRKAIFFRRKF